MIIDNYEVHIGGVAAVGFGHNGDKSLNKKIED